MKMTTLVGDLLNCPFSKLAPQQQQSIVKTGRPCPNLSNLKTSSQLEDFVYQRLFDPVKYDQFNWLTGCEVRSKLFCWPCLLFSSDKKHNATWIEYGFNDLSCLDIAATAHESHKSHIKSIVELKRFEGKEIRSKSYPGSKEQVKQHNEIVDLNRQCLFFHATLMSTFSSLTLPLFFAQNNEIIQDEKTDCEKISISELTLGDLAKTSMEYESHLEQATKLFNDFPRLQMDLATSLSFIIKDQIKRQLDASPFVSIILFPSMVEYMNRKTHLIVLFRYIHCGSITERCISSHPIREEQNNVTDGDISLSDDLLSLINKTIRQWGIEEKLVGITFESLPLTTNIVDMIKQELNKKYPRIIFTDFHSSGINVSISYMFLLMFGKEKANFFQDLSLIKLFYDYNHVCQLLHVFVDMNGLLNLNSFYHHLDDCLTIGGDSSQFDPDSNLANDTKNRLSKFDTILLIGIFSRWLPEAQRIETELGKCSDDYDKCQELVQNKVAMLYDDNSELTFDKIWCAAKMIYFSIQNKYYPKDETKAKAMENVFNNVYDNDAMKNSFAELYRTSHQLIVEKFRLRFSAMWPFVQFSILICAAQPNVFGTLLDTFLTQGNELLQIFIDWARLESELVTLNGQNFFGATSIESLFKLLFTHDLHLIFHQTYRLTQLILTCPTRWIQVGQVSTTNKQVQKVYSMHEWNQCDAWEFILLNIDFQLRYRHGSKEALKYADHTGLIPVITQLRPLFYDAINEEWCQRYAENTENTTLNFTYFKMPL